MDKCNECKDKNEIVYKGWGELEALRWRDNADKDNASSGVGMMANKVYLDVVGIGPGADLGTTSQNYVEAVSIRKKTETDKYAKLAKSTVNCKSPRHVFVFMSKEQRRKWLDQMLPKPKRVV